MRLKILLPCLVLALGTASCGELPSAPGGAEAWLVVQANVAGTSTSLLTIEVGGPGITTPLVFNLSVQNGIASGTLTVPAGSARTFTGTVFDDYGIQTHRGSRTESVLSGANPPLSLTLLPLAGEQLIEVSIGSFMVELSPTEASLPVGGTLQLSATVRDVDARVVKVPVQWATLHPAIATVDAGGRVTARSSGQAQIVAVYAGIAASTRLTVGNP